MIFNRALVVVLAALASSTNGFVNNPSVSFARSSSLNMVADNAKVVLVTGSSRGLGRSIALEIGKAGQKVIINYVSDSSKESAESLIEEIKAAGGDAIALQADSEFLLTCVP
jgi:predicted lactoylglutathione lyase